MSVLCVSLTVRRRYEFRVPLFIYFIVTGRLPTFLFDGRKRRRELLCRRLFAVEMMLLLLFFLLAFNRLHR